MIHIGPLGLDEKADQLDEWIEKETMGRRGKAARRDNQTTPSLPPDANGSLSPSTVTRGIHHSQGQKRSSDSSLIDAIQSFERELRREMATKVGRNSNSASKITADIRRIQRKGETATKVRTGSDSADRSSTDQSSFASSPLNSPSIVGHFINRRWATKKHLRQRNRRSQSKEVGSARSEQEEFDHIPELVGRGAFLEGINSADRAFARRAIGLFGLATIANIYSKHWFDRHQGILQMARLLKLSEGTPKEQLMLDTAVPVLAASLRDNLFDVFFVGMSLFNVVIRRVGAVADEHFQKRFATLMAPIIASRLGDTVHSNDAVDHLTSAPDKKMANLFLRSLLTPMLAQSQQNRAHQRAELGRTKFILKVMEAQWTMPGAGVSSMPSAHQLLCPFINRCLANSYSESIRTIGKQLALSMYSRSTPSDRYLTRRLLSLPNGNGDPTTMARANHRQLAQLQWELERIDQKEADGMIKSSKKDER